MPTWKSAASPNRLADLIGRPAWQAGHGYKPRGKSRIRHQTAEPWLRDGLVERRVLGGVLAIVLTEKGQAVAEGRLKNAGAGVAGREEAPGRIPASRSSVEAAARSTVRAWWLE